MSGFALILHKDGRPPDPAVTAAIMDALRFRGPDAQRVRLLEQAALIHTLLRTGDPLEDHEQPLCSKDNIWFVGHARLDARDELIASLRSYGSAIAPDASSASLILESYRLWGDSCVERFLGDFAFAIWDAPRRRLFCARDHLGVRPFFYADRPGSFVLSNTLDAVRLHPDVPQDLDDLAIADFLLFGGIQDPDRTSYAAIRRLPAAHALVLEDDNLRLRRYWSLPIDEPVYYRRKEDYTGRFNELVASAVRDRARTDRLVICMSGGVDSSTLAATAVQPGVTKARVSAFTVVYDRLTRDDERHYAGLVAHHLGIPIHFWVADAPGRCEYAAEPVHTSPEPSPEPWFHKDALDQYRETAALGRVAFWGEGPDNALHYDWRPHLSYLWHARRYDRLMLDIVSHLAAHRRIPLLPTIPRMWRERNFDRDWSFPFPAWINEEFAARLNLRQRYQEINSPKPADHPVRPTAYRSLQSILWPQLFESCDPEATGVPLEFRHPYCDLRVLRFMLSVPALPWCRVKYLLRAASRDKLPSEVLKRRKTPLQAHPEFNIASALGPPPLLQPAPELTSYVRLDLLHPMNSAGEPRFFMETRPAALNWWLLARNHQFEDSFRKERAHEYASAQ